MPGVAFHVAVDSLGFVYEPDVYDNQIVKMTPNGGIVTTWGSPGSGENQFDSPRFAAVDRDGNVYVSDYNNNRIEKYAPSQ